MIILMGRILGLFKIGYATIWFTVFAMPEEHTLWFMIACARTLIVFGGIPITGHIKGRELATNVTALFVLR
jgi:hypothetical protein